MSRPSLEGLNLVYPPIDPSQHQFDLTNPINTSELDAQLDLWTNLSFHQDEPLTLRPLTPTGEDKESRSYQMETHSTQGLDLNNYNFFNQFSIDPFLVPPATSTLPHGTSADSNSNSSSDSAAIDRPLAKRQRTTSIKNSIANDPSTPMSPTLSVQLDGAAGVCAAEDKRRRNTAASARFRAKKKEREAALEKRSKELETRVNELERECESLRRENGWLKGLVVGVTGASAGAASSSGNMTVVPQGTKRRRSSDEAEEKPTIAPQSEK